MQDLLTVPEVDGSARLPEFDGWRRWLRTVEAAAASGIAFAALSAFSYLMLFALPAINASDREILAFYRKPGAESQALVALNLMVVAVIGFLWFIAVIRSRMGEREPKLFATVFFGGGILISAGLLLGTAMLAAPSIMLEVGGSVTEPESASMARALGVAVLIGVVPKLQAVFMFSTGTLGLRTGTLPRWLVVVTILSGAGLLINISFFTPSVYVFPAWVALVSIVLLVRPRPLDRVEI